MKKIFYCLLLLTFSFASTTNGQTVNIDQTFSGCGSITATFPGYVNLVIEHIVIRPGGKILSVATGTVPNSVQHHSLFAQYNPDGSPDLSFGTNGKAVIALNTKTVCKKIALLPDGKIIGVGTDSDNEFSTAHMPVIFKLNANGSVDNSFNNNGTSGGKNALQFNEFSRGGFTDVAILPDGKILAGGESIGNGIGGLSGPGVMRFNADGTIDETFGNMPGNLGKIVVQKAYVSNINMLSQEDGKIVLGYVRDNNGQGLTIKLEMVSLAADGSGTLATVDAGQNIKGNSIMKVAKQVDGKFVFTATSNETTSKICVLRYNSDLTPDASFGVNGVVSLSNLDGSGYSFYSANLGFQPDGKILIAGGRTTGYPNNSPLVIRLLPNGQLDFGFNSIGYYVVPAHITSAQLVDVIAFSNNACIISSQDNCRLTKITTEALAATGGALNFDGGDDEGNIGNWFNAQNFSIEMWVKPSVTQTQYASIIDNGLLQLYSSSGGVSSFYFYLSTTTVPNTYLSVQLLPNTWQHIVLVKSATSASMYKNGVLESTTAISGIIPYNINTLWLGRGGPLGRGWNGSIDEVRFWNRPLTQTEIQSNMNCQLACTQTDLLAYYKFNQGFSACNNAGENSLIDASGNNRHASLSNFALTGSTSNWIAGNVSGSCAGGILYYVDADGDGYGTGSEQQFCSNPGTGYASQNGDCNDANAAIHPGATEVCNGIDDNCDGSTDEDVNTAPPTITANGDTKFCEGGSVILTASAGTSYLWSNGQTTQSITVTQTGNYTVTVTDVGECSSTSASTNVKVTSMPALFSVTGGGTITCSGETIPVGLSGSEIGVGYRLFINGIPNFANVINGTGNAISFGPQVTAGHYAVAATVYAVPGDPTCHRIMSGSASITIFPATMSFSVTGGGCGSSIIGLDGSELGISYQLKLSGIPIGSPQTGTGSAIDFGVQTQTGTYTIEALPSTCDPLLMSGAAVIEPSPILFNVTGGGSYCSGDLGVPIGLSGSQPFVVYQLIRNGISLLPGIIGTGSPLDFGNQTVSGNYTIVAYTYSASSPGNVGCLINMNGAVDVNILPLNTYYRDADGDSYGSNSNTTQACSMPAGYVINSTDCDDTNPAINPAAAEVCDGADNDCDGLIDEGLKTKYYIDADGDGFGNPDEELTVEACTAPEGYVASNTDCNDNPLAGGATVNPGATETCNGVDDDCDGLVDEGVKTTFYRDADGDSYGNAAITTQACATPTGYVTNSTDCNDNAITIHPNATEACGNGIDDDCDGQVDENCGSVKIYRSKQIGSWNNVTTWETSLDGGLTWTPATATPTSADGKITVRHLVTVTTVVNADEVTVEVNQHLIIYSAFTLLDGPGKDLIVDGTLSIGIGNSIGILQGNGTTTINKTFNWTDGKVAAPIIITTTGRCDATLSGEYSRTLQLSSTITNYGIFTMGVQDFYRGIISFQNGSIINYGQFNNNGFNGGFIKGLGANQFVNAPSGIFSIRTIQAFEVDFINQGTIKGTGLASFANINNTGIISPALNDGQTGILTLNSITNPLTASSELKIKIKKNGNTPPTSDQLLRSGNLTLAGTLTVNDIGNIPNFSSFTIISLTSGVISGTFNTVNLPTGYRLEVGTNYVRVLKTPTSTAAATNKIPVQKIIDKQKLVPKELIVTSSPNPFRQQMFFTITSPVSGKVSIAITDVNGKMLQNLSHNVVGGQPARVEFSKKLNASGALLYHASIEGYMATGKLMKLD